MEKREVELLYNFERGYFQPATRDEPESGQWPTHYYTVEIPLSEIDSFSGEMEIESFEFDPKTGKLKIDFWIESKFPEKDDRY